MLYDPPEQIHRTLFSLSYVATALWVHELDGLDCPEEWIAELDNEAEEALENPHLVRLIQAACWRPVFVHTSDGRGGVARASRRSQYTWSTAGHDFYLTREGHGAGFWDRGLGMVGTALTKVAKDAGGSSFAPPGDDEEDPMDVVKRQLER